MNKSVRYLIYSSLSLLVTLPICYFLLPEISSTEGGVSNYGVHRQTIIFYTLGFSINIIFIVLSALNLASKPQLMRLLKTLMYITAFLLTMVWLSTYPYKINDTFGNFHKYTSQALFGYETLFGVWLVILSRRDWLGYVFFGVQLSGSILALLTVYGNLHLLFVGQLLEVIGFGSLLARSIAVLTRKLR